MPRTGPPHPDPYGVPARPPSPPAPGEHATGEIPVAPAGPARGRGLRPLAVAGVAVVAGLAGGGVTVGALAIAGALDGGDTVVVRDALPLPATVAEAEATAPAAPAGEGSGEGPTIQAVVARSAPGVVTITVGGGDADASDAERSGRLGSGFLIDDDGHVLSNAHVVDDAGTATVTFSDGTETTARVLGRDESSDLAVLRVSEIPASAAALPLGSSGGLTVGDPVVAIGNPFGLDRTATSGIVSALKRIIRAPNAFEIQNVIQTDAAINQGNSGGPLLDGTGRVIGINTQIATGSGGNDGIGFAVPIDTIRPIANSIIRDGTAEHAWAGVTGRTLTPAIARAIGHPDARGVVVVAVDERGPAHRAGLRPATTPPDVEVPRGGDIIVGVDGRSVVDMADVSRAVSAHPVGADIRLTVLRDGARTTVTLRLADRPGDVGIAPGAGGP